MAVNPMVVSEFLKMLMTAWLTLSRVVPGSAAVTAGVPPQTGGHKL